MSLKTSVNDYSRGRSWWAYLPLLILLYYAFHKLLGFHPNEDSGLLLAPLRAFFFGLHELAHIVTVFLPSIFTAASGSFAELLLGIGLVIMGYRQKSYFAMTACLVLFLMLACLSAGAYMADARSQSLDLVSPFGEGAIHDWNYVFGELNILPHDKTIGGSFKVAGIGFGAIGLILATYLLINMIRLSNQKPKDDKAKELVDRSSASMGYDSRAVPLGTPRIAKTDKVKELYPTPIKGRMVDEAPDKDKTSSS